jgi:hypothetical protein
MLIKIQVINQKSNKMNKFKYILFVLIAPLLFVGCDDEDVITFSNSDAFVMFEATQASGAETGDTIKVVVQVSDVNRSGDITVDFDFNTTDISNAAVLGDDFEIINSSQTLTFTQGQYQDTIFIRTIDNDLYETDKAFNIVLTANSANYKLGLAASTIGTTIVCTIIDDEHPLATWFGDYSVYCDSYGDVAYGYADGAWDESWSNVVISADPSDVTNVLILGIAGSANSIVANIDLDTGIITIAKEQALGDVYGYGESLIYKGDDQGGSVDEDVVGTVNTDGSIDIDLFSIYESDSDQLWTWDSFNTTWTKQ